MTIGDKHHTLFRERSRPRDQSGVALVEFVIAIPLMLVLVMGTAEFGRAFVQYNTLTKSVRDGARYACSRALNGSTGVVLLTTSVRTATQNLVAYGQVGTGATPLLPGLSPANVTVNAAGPASVQVSATYMYAPIFATLPLFQGSAITPSYTFQAAVTMRAL